MAAHDKLVLEEVDDEYEYVARAIDSVSKCSVSDLLPSYEGLPPNFSLAANMAAGAFAGIAVCTFKSRDTRQSRLTTYTGALCHVPYRSSQGSCAMSVFPKLDG